MSDRALHYSNYFWQGERTRLRPLRVEDVGRAYSSSLDSPSRQFLQLGIELPTSLELQTKAIEKYAGCKETNGVIVFAIENLAGDHVGNLSLHSRDDKNGHFSFGVGIDRQYRRQGYAADAVQILLGYGFRERRYQKCNSACPHSNEASIEMHKKLGFKEEGRRRRQLFFNGEYHDDILFGLTREEFESQIAD